METILTCPLGHQCETAKDNKIYRCAWYTKVIGKNPQSEEVFDEWGCAMGWLPVLLIENAQTNRGQTEAICSMRDETLKRQEMALSMMQKQNLLEQI